MNVTLAFLSNTHNHMSSIFRRRTSSSSSVYCTPAANNRSASSRLTSCRCCMAVTSACQLPQTWYCRCRKAIAAVCVSQCTYSNDNTAKNLACTNYIHPSVQHHCTLTNSDGNTFPNSDSTPAVSITAVSTCRVTWCVSSNIIPYCTDLHAMYIQLLIPPPCITVFSVRLRSSYARYCDRHLAVRLSITVTVTVTDNRVVHSTM